MFKKENKKENKIIFWGTPEFAAIILEMLIKNGFKPVAVVTAPDRPIGRHVYLRTGKQTLTPSKVKQVSLKYGIEILQPTSFKNNPDIIDRLSSFQPDLFILAAYGLILPSKVLKIPRYGSLNIHPSLLPEYRGASPIQAAILNGDKKTGVSIILMDEKVDHGPIISDLRFKIVDLRITYPILSNKLAKLGGQLLIKTLPKWLAGKIKPIPQDHLKASFTKRITKQDGRVNWSNSAQEIERMVRAYQPWPGAFATLKIKNQKLKIKNKTLKIIKANILEIEHNKNPGTIFLTKSRELAVVCKENALILEKIQLEGKKPTTGQSFLNGYPGIVNTTLG